MPKPKVPSPKKDITIPPKRETGTVETPPVPAKTPEASTAEPAVEVARRRPGMSPEFTDRLAAAMTARWNARHGTTDGMPVEIVEDEPSIIDEVKVSAPEDQDEAENDEEEEEDGEDDIVWLNPQHLVLSHDKKTGDAGSITKQALKICRARWPEADVRILSEEECENYEDEAEDTFIYIVSGKHIPEADIEPYDSGVHCLYIKDELQAEVITAAKAAFEKEKALKAQKAAQEAHLKPKKERVVGTLEERQARLIRESVRKTKPTSDI